MTHIALDKVGRTSVRFLKSLYAGQGDLQAAVGYAEAHRHWADRNLIIGALKSTVSAISAAGSSSLMQEVGTDFMLLIHPHTALGKLKSLRWVPSNVRILRGTAEASAFWLGEGQPAPLSAQAFDAESLRTLKVASVCVSTRELMRAAGTLAESVLGAALARACVAAMDEAFLDPNNAGSADAKPASIAYGQPSLVSSGSTLAAIDADLRAAVQTLADNGSDLTSATWIVHPRTAIFLSLLRGSGGALAYQHVGSKSGQLAGLPLITSPHIPINGSPGTTSIILVDEQRISYADEGITDFDVSENASLQMLSNPTNSAANGTATTMVSMFQTGSVATKIVRHANWSAPYGTAVALSGLAY